jgi:hypothetical protein
MTFISRLQFKCIELTTQSVVLVIFDSTDVVRKWAIDSGQSVYLALFE